MAVQKLIHVGSRDIPMRASALIPRLYRVKFGRDMIQDMKSLQDDYNAAMSGEEKSLSVSSLEIFEDVAWMMARHAYEHELDRIGRQVLAREGAPAMAPFPDDPDDWLDSFDGILDIYEALPQMMGLWSENLKQTSVPAKK